MMDLTQIRDHLDQLDEIILTSLAERMTLIDKVAKLKKMEKIPVVQPERRKAVLIALRSRAVELELDPGMVEELFKIIIHHAEDREQKLIDEG